MRKFLLTILLITLSSSAAAALWKCTDAGGAVHYLPEIVTDGSKTCIALVEDKPVQAASPTGKGRQELLIESRGLPEFDAENNTANTVSPEDKKFAEEVLPVVSSLRNTKDAEKNRTALSGLNRLLEKYPEWSDGYLLRATLSILVGDNNYTNHLSDIDSALKFRQAAKFKSAYDTEVEMYQLRAKLDLLAGKHQQAMFDLEMAIKKYPDHTKELFNTGGVKPDDESNPTVLHRKDFEGLIAKYPNDYRAYMYRGLFYGGFTFFDEKLYDPVLRDLSQALKLAPKSALVNYFIGKTINAQGMFTMAAASDVSDLTGKTGGYRQKTNKKALEYFKEAARLDTKFVTAYAMAANSLLKLKRCSEAIPYFDMVVKLEPSNGSAYHDRGVCKQETNDFYGAISDFSKTIELNKGQPGSWTYMYYQNRAYSYRKTGNLKKAIKDYSKSIGLMFASNVFIMSLPRIRSIYPEFDAISDEDLLEGLRLKYFPNMIQPVFFEHYKKKTESSESTTLHALYVARGDSYLDIGNWRMAASEYGRALHQSPTFPLDRWKVVHKSRELEYAIDAQTIDFSKSNQVQLWLRVTNTASGNYIQTNYQMNCSQRTAKATSAEMFDSQGNSRGAVAYRQLTSVAPEGIEEVLYTGSCAIQP